MAKIKHISDGTNTWDVGGGTEVFTKSVYTIAITAFSANVSGNMASVTAYAGSMTSPNGNSAPFLMNVTSYGIPNGANVEFTFSGTLPAGNISQIVITDMNGALYQIDLDEEDTMKSSYLTTLDTPTPLPSIFSESSSVNTVYDALKVVSPLTVTNDGVDDCLGVDQGGFAGGLNLVGNTLNLVSNDGTTMGSVNLTGGPKKIVAYWDPDTSTLIGSNCSKYERLDTLESDINIGDIVIASPATAHDCCYTDLVALNIDDTGQSRFFIDIHGLQTSPLEQNGSYYADINYISADRQWVFVVADTLTCLDQSSNEYTKYVLIPYSIIPILDDDDMNWSHTGRGISVYDGDIIDCSGKVLFSYGCGYITNAQPIDLVDSSANTVSPDDSRLVIGPNKQFTQIFRFYSGSNQVVGVKADYNSLCVPTAIYVTGSMGMPKSVPLYYDPTDKVYKLTNGVDLTNDSWTWFVVTGQYTS